MGSEIVREHSPGTQRVPDAERKARQAERRGETAERSGGERQAEAGRQERHRDCREGGEDAEPGERQRSVVDRAHEQDSDPGAPADTMEESESEGTEGSAVGRMPVRLRSMRMEMGVRAPPVLVGVRVEGAAAPAQEQ